MELTEYQSKQVLAELGIGIPEGYLARSDEEAAAFASQLAPSPLVLKAQIQAGGRALGYFLDNKPVGQSDRLPASSAEKTDSRESGVRFVDTPEQVLAQSRRMLGRTLVTHQTGVLGQPVSRVYLEKHVDLVAELYLAFTIDAQSGEVICLTSKAGGVSIEAQTLADSPASKTAKVSGIQRIPFDIRWHDNNEQDLLRAAFEKIGDSLQESAQHRDALVQLAASLFDLFVSRDATLIELNPFGFTAEGNLVVLDASIIWDDNALFRQGHPEELEAYETLSRAEHDARVAGLNYHDLEGNVGCLSNGAGLAMATNDAITACGGVAGNFLDVPPSVSSEQLAEAFCLLFASQKLEVVLVNIFGGGVMRCGTVSEVLLDLVQTTPADTIPPLVVRLAGVEASEAIRQLEDVGAPFFYCHRDLESAAQSAVQLAADRRMAHSGAPSAGMWAHLQSFFKGRKPTNNKKSTNKTTADVDSR